jgi:hypothetical protein
MLLTAFCLVLCSLGFSGRASGATITVTNTNDSGTGSLRDAITMANANPPGTINITATGTITLLSTLPAITANMTLTGPGANLLTVSGNNSTTVSTIFTITNGVTASISGLTIANGNSNSSDQGGGGILNDGTLTVSNCTISGNSGTGSVNNEGGGITNFGTLTLSSSTVSGNSAALGGGILNGDGNTLTVTNSTFSGNSATAKGGGIYNLVGGTLTVTSSTFFGNSGGEGGGIETNSSSTTITNTIVAGNTATAADDIDGTYSPTSGGGNVITPTEPIALAPLANYGGPTQTMLPAPNSPAICAGNKTGAPTTDQRGFTTGAAAYCTSGKIDSGAVQTNYTSIQFTNPNTSIGGYAAAVSNPASFFPAAPIVSVTENSLNQGGVPVTLTSDATGAMGLGPMSTVAGTGATFSSITVPEAGSFTLSAQLTPGTATLNTSANLRIVVITLSPPTLAGATVNRPYSVTFSASGGTTSTYTFSLTGTPPTGMTFTAPTLAGTPTATGSFGLTITATDGNGFSGTQSYTLAVNNPVTATTIVPAKALTIGQSAPFTPVTGSGGTAPLTYSISPTLPAGLSISPTTGAITGTPTAASPATTYSVTVTDANGATANSSFSLTVNSAVVAMTAVSTTMLTVNQPSASFTPVTGSGGTPPLTFSVSPALPAGLSISATSGAITGIPTAASPATSYTVTVTDSNHATGQASFTLTVNPAVVATTAIATTMLTINQPSTSFTPVTGSGGTAPRTYSVSPSLPAGLGINSSTGVITGVPSATSPATSYTVTVTDSNHATAQAPFTLTVNSAVTATTSVPATMLTVSQSSASFTPVTGSGGTAPLTYSISPSLPAGLSIGPSTGTITGVPMAASPATSYTVTVTDSNHATAQTTFTLTVNPAVTATTSIPATMLTVSQSPASFMPVKGSGGTAPLTYTISPSLPAGLSISPSTGTITGIPTTASPATSYTVTVTDSNHVMAQAPFMLTVNPVVTATATIPATTLTVNQSASFTPVTGSGGTAPLHYAILPSLPAALSISPSTGAITGMPAAISPTTSYTVTVTDANQVMAQATFTLTVSQAGSSVSVASSTNGISTVNNPVTFTATVTPFSGAAPIPPPFPGSAAAVTGSVTFTDNGNTICSSPVPVMLSPVSGLYQAACPISSLTAAASPHTIVATYTGNSNYTGSHNSVLQTVQPAASTTAVNSSPMPSIVNNPKHFHDSVVFTAAITPSNGSVPLSSTAVVTFMDGGTILPCTVAWTPATGIATCSIPPLTAGSHIITASYGNDLNYKPSSNIMTQIVQDYSLTTSTTIPGEVFVTQGFTSTNDEFSPQTITAAPVSIFGFSTTADNPLQMTCTLMSQPSGATTLPTCSFPASSTLPIAPSGSQASIAVVINAGTPASPATPGQYVFAVIGTDPTTGLVRTATPPLSVDVRSLGTPVGVPSGASTTAPIDFNLPAGVTLSNFVCLSVKGPVPVNCTPTAAGVTTTAGEPTIQLTLSGQSAPLTVTINTGTTMTQLVTSTNIFAAGFFGIPVLALLGLVRGGKRNRKTFLRFIGLVYIVFATLQVVGCGGSFMRTESTGTIPAGTYLIQTQGTGSDGQTYQAVIQLSVIR